MLIGAWTRETFSVFFRPTNLLSQQLTKLPADRVLHPISHKISFEKSHKVIKIHEIGSGMSRKNDHRIARKEVME